MASTSTTEVSHLNTRLVSKTLPIVLRTTEVADAPRFSAILSDPSNEADPHASKLDVPAAAAIITRQRESAAVPTVLSSSDGGTHVVSGPSRVNMVVVYTGGGGEEEEEEEELVIGLGGYGAIKDWVRDGKPCRAGDVGAMIDPAYRGRGYAAEAIRLATDWAFAPASEGGLQLDLVTLTTLDSNVPMIKLADEKLKLKKLGVRRNSTEPGHEKDVEVYWELTKKDWEEISA
ncbi:hypothetical protein PWT90_08437 [Aphanocladium album]|nr:hypothetical protein PWT90_08437 [Aphanocladium album]